MKKWKRTVTLSSVAALLVSSSFTSAVTAEDAEENVTTEQSEDTEESSEDEEDTEAGEDDEANEEDEADDEDDEDDAEESEPEEENDTPPLSFQDMSESDWFYDDVTTLFEEGIIEGYEDQTFRPNQPVNREQTAVMINRAFDIETEEQPDPGFRDVGEDHFAYEAIATLADLGILEGTQSGQFQGDRPLTREQMALILDRLFELEEPEEPIEFNDLNPNRPNVNVDAIQRVVANEVANGYEDNTFRPNQPTTRSEFSALVARLLDEELDESLEESDSDEPTLDNPEPGPPAVERPNDSEDEDDNDGSDEEADEEVEDEQ
ncbi:S-layer homology domain-containing protein [Salsuginibacillus kocurii]|uniref:S-layer homology domain-containing protein n=1 Tax=Salsuginibacillus kocurii TaxID=427078 RepID=UPI0003AA60A6|nr:S-layer homology domain-containing protein [Salsuginibacillus kocurii]